ncbi:M48 family metallopeptidase [Sneathiella sp.]|jgi:Zn-dependent protease with chaperone function|uniref:M48 family metallopeptidase n=1 Tax=Sneathiella sp. TaxID=1964365 RepID=UPI0039E2FC7D
MHAIGRYFDGKTAQETRVVLTIVEPDLCLYDEAKNLIGRWPLADLRDENAPYRPNELTLSHSHESDERLVVTEPVFIESLKIASPNLRKRRKGAAGWWKPVVAWTAAVVVCAGLFFGYGLPVLAYGIASLVPYDTRSKIGEGVENIVIQRLAKTTKNNETNPVCEGAVAQSAIEGLVQEFVTAADADIPPVKVTVISSKVPNAFALPAGRMVITSALIDMAEDPNALAGVLAHEFGHLVEKHPMSLFVTNVGIAAFFSMALGDVSGGTVIAAVAQSASGAAYSRSYEDDADETAVYLMNRLDMDIAPVLPLLKKLGEKVPEAGLFSVFSSHPDMDSRIQAIKEAKTTGTLNAFSERAWAAIKIMCKGSV